MKINKLFLILSILLIIGNIQVFSAPSGGTITTFIGNNSINYTVHTFLSNGTFNPDGITITAEVLIVSAGGGSGGLNGGDTYGTAGGGAGGLNNTNMTISVNQTIIVGSKGLGGSSTGSTHGFNGGNSCIGNSCTIGGGYGGGYETGQSCGGTGGSGGGSVSYFCDNNYASGTTGQGKYGGASSGAGGDGAGGGFSTNGSSGSGAYGGNSGLGINLSINGSTAPYSYGGPSGGYGLNKNGISFGGAGTTSSANGGGCTNATSYGSGAGGLNGATGSGSGSNGCNGADGIVIIRYLTPTPPNNFTITATNTWNGSSILNFNATIVNGGTTYYGTTTGNISTNHLINATYLGNITIYATGYIPVTYNNINFSILTLQGNLSQNNISVNTIYPLNGVTYNNATINLTWTVTSTINASCQLYLNSQLYKNITTTTGQYGNLTNLTDGTYNYYVTCTDGLHTNTTTNKTFYVDKTSPVWTVRTINTANTTSIDRDVKNWLYFNDTISDANLFMYNLTAYMPNGSVWYNNYTFNTTTSTFNIQYNKTISSSDANGTYRINYYAEDDHTALTIPDYIIEEPIKEDIIKDLNFDTVDTKINIIPETDTITASAIKQVDRYNFAFTYPTTKPTRVYHVTSDKIIYYRSQYKFPSFVTGKNWVDFNEETVNKNYEVTKINDYDYQISITDPLITKETPISEEIIFESLGGLNIVNETYTFQIFVYASPNITNTSPSQSFSMYDNTTQVFRTTATDINNLSLTYNYYYDNSLVYTGQNYSFYAPFNAHGSHNLTVYVTNTATKTSSYTWNVTILNNNIGPVLTSLSYTPVTDWYANLENTYITCAGYDQDNETASASLTYDIDYTTDGSTWAVLTPVYVSGNDWQAYINLSALSGDVLSARCKISDGIDSTSYSYINNFVTIGEVYYEPSNIYINPNAGLRDFVTPINCYVGTYGSTSSNSLVYSINATHNGLTQQISIGTNNKALYDMANIEYGENVTFTCQVYDGIVWTTPVTTGNIQRQHKTQLFMYNNGGDEVIQSNKIYGKGLLADFYNEANVTIVGAYADCNGDDLYDYYWDYTSSPVNFTTETFNCYNQKGLITHSVGVFLNKVGVNNQFCGSTTTGVCKIQRSYSVIVK